MIKYKKASKRDQTLIQELGKKTFIESHGQSASHVDIANYLALNFSLNSIEEELNNSKNIFHLLYYKEVAVGYSKIIFSTQHPEIHLTNVSKLERIYILKDYYDLSLGYQLFLFLLKLAKENKQEGMWLNVWKENSRAISFYKKLGFKTIGSFDFKISEFHSNPNHQMYLEF